MSPEEEMQMLRAMLTQYGQSGTAEQSPLEARRAGNVQAGDYHVQNSADPYASTPRADGMRPVGDIIDSYYDRKDLERILNQPQRDQIEQEIEASRVQRSLQRQPL